MDPRGSTLGLASLLILGVASPGAAQDEGTTLDLSMCALSASGFTLESTNPYFPMTVGSEWVLEGGDERVVITVLDETETVGGVTTRVIEEREFEDGEIVSHESGWRADAPESRPGIIMPADPRPAMRFQMEVAPGAADEGEIVEVGTSVEVPAGTFADAIRLQESNPLEDEEEYKFYAKGVGMVVDDDLELVSHR